MALLNEEHLEIRRTVREFVEREVVPIADKLDNEEKEIPMPVIRKMAELGYFGLIFPTEYGGMGLDTLSMAIVTEELSRGWMSVASLIARGNLLIGSQEMEEEIAAELELIEAARAEDKVRR